MDIQSLKEFEAWWSENYDRDDFEDVVFSEILNEYESNYIVTDDLNKAWSAWQAAKAQAVPEWISVEDELPKDGAKVLCYGRQFMCVGVFDGDDFFDPLDGQSFVKDCVTHWMQLPASPKAQEQKG